jgi:hypothetical protein
MALAIAALAAATTAHNLSDSLSDNSLSDNSWARGITFGGDGWSVAQYGSNASAAALAALAATGASHVRLLVTAYQDSINATTIHAISGESPLASTTRAQLLSALSAAKQLNLSVFLSPVLDINWDMPSNGRSADGTPFPANASFAASALIGSTFSDAEWAEWFEAYAAWILPLAELAEQQGVAMFGLASGLDAAFVARPAEWRTLCASVRAAYSGELLIAAGSDAAPRITWWSALDAVGVNLFGSLGGNLSLGVAPSVDDLQAAWAPQLAALASLHAATALPLVVTSVGFQSRPSCHVRPNGTRPHNPGDDSPWVTSFDMDCQANAYEALLRVFVGSPGQAPPALPYLRGLFWWLWSADPTSGGTSDSTYSPHGKPAEGVLRRYYGAGADDWGGGAIREALAAEHDRAVARRRAAAGGRQARTPAGRRQWQGWVFGSSEWSSPYFRLDSEGARASLDEMVRATHADSVELIVQWCLSESRTRNLLAGC